MNRFLTIFTLLVIAAIGFSASADLVDPYTAITLKRSAQASMHKAPRVNGEQEEESAPYFPMLIKISDESAIDELCRLGTVIMGRRGQILLACVPVEQVENILPIYGICRISAARTLNTHLDKARAMSGVDLVHAGTSPLPHGYDGSGVVTGFTDTGFDPGHIAFRGRVGWISDFRDTYALRTVSDTPEAITAWVTDSKDNYHATHVAGILAGGYTANGLHGVATGSDIAATTSMLTDVGILAGIEDIIAYAKSKGKPAVINMSLGTNTGPHDGSDLFCQYLDLCAEDAVICMSAGNFGQLNISGTAQFTRERTSVGTQVNTYNGWDGINVSGIIDIWSTDAAPVSIQINTYDMETRSMVYSSPWIGIGNGCLTEWYTDSQMDADWSKFFEGSIYVASEISPENGRYNATLIIDTHCPTLEASGRWAKYYHWITMSGEPGTGVELYTDGSRLFVSPNGGDEILKGSPWRSISNIACGQNTIIVGACNSRNSVTSYLGETVSWDFQTDRVADFSAYGTLNDGRSLPHLCAPGNYVVSAASRPFFTSHLDQFSAITHILTDGGRNHLWFPLCGTSMATPLVAGVAALWLQANPYLTAAEIRQTMIETANADFADINDPRWGAGCIDAYAGLCKIIKSSGAENVSIPALVRCCGSQVSAEIPGSRVNVSLHTIDGSLVDACCDCSDYTSQPLAPGIYIIRVSSPDPAIRPFTSKFIIK